MMEFLYIFHFSFKSVHIDTWEMRVGVPFILFINVLSTENEKKKKKKYTLLNVAVWSVQETGTTLRICFRMNSGLLTVYCNTVGMRPNWCAPAEPALLSPVAGRIEMLEALQVTVGIPWHWARIGNGRLSPVLHLKVFAPKPSGSCNPLKKAARWCSKQTILLTAGFAFIILSSLNPSYCKYLQKRPVEERTIGVLVHFCPLQNVQPLHIT